MSTSHALTTAEAETARKEDAPPCKQKTPASQPRKIEEGAEDNEDEEVLLHIPASFDVKDHGGGVARGAGAGTVDPFDTVGMLRNLWWRMSS